MKETFALRWATRREGVAMTILGPSCNLVLNSREFIAGHEERVFLSLQFRKKES
jgi:hypothetical protein